MLREKPLPSGNTILYILFLKYEENFILGHDDLQFCGELPRFVTRQQVS